jgi:hypothetical protein
LIVFERLHHGPDWPKVVQVDDDLFIYETIKEQINVL